jgi:hypothetical protein
MYSKFGMAAIIARGVFYAGIFWFFLSVTSSADETIRGIGGGIIAADLLTWLGRSLDKAFKYPAEFFWDTAVNVVIVVLLVSVFGVPFGSGSEAWAMGVMAFMATCGLKVFWYIAQDIDERA